MQDEFYHSLGDVASSSQVAEAEPLEGIDMSAHSDENTLSTFGRLYSTLLRPGEPLTLGEDWAATLITELQFYYFTPFFSTFLLYDGDYIDFLTI